MVSNIWNYRAIDTAVYGKKERSVRRCRRSLVVFTDAICVLCRTHEFRRMAFWWASHFAGWGLSVYRDLAISRILQITLSRPHFTQVREEKAIFWPREKVQIHDTKLSCQTRLLLYLFVFLSREWCLVLILIKVHTLPSLQSMMTQSWPNFDCMISEGRQNWKM